MSETGAGQDQDPELVYWWSPRGDDRVFDLSDWPPEALEVTRSLLAGAEVPHRWEDDRLVVDASLREEAQALLDEVVAASHPRLEADEDRTAYELADWPDDELADLAEALDREGIVHEWTDDGDLLVYAIDEERVDALFDALGLHGPDDGRISLDGEELTQLLSTAFVAADKLGRDARDPDAVVDAVSSSRRLADVSTPVGFDADAWTRLNDQLAELARMLESADDTADDEEVSRRARDVRERLRAWI
jgi:hypothetical protein